MPSTVILKALGLNTQPNQLDLPPGSMIEASNVVIKSDNIVEPRRGYKVYGESFGTGTDRAKQLSQYKDRILRHFASTLQFQNGVNNAGEVNFDSFAGSFSEVESGLRIKSIEANGNYYFTTFDGIKKISSATGPGLSTAQVVSAGGVKAIDAEGEVIYTPGNITGFLPQDAAVAYRILWGIKDANNNLIVGAPSQRVEVYNSLLTLLIQDFNILLGALDNIAQTGSMIDDGDYVETLALGANSSATDLQTALNNLVTKLDEDIEYVGVGSPLTLSSVNVTSNVATMTFSAGTVTDYITAGQKIILAGFSPSDIDGIQTVATVGATTLTFNVTAPNGAYTFASATVNSYAYENISIPATIDEPTPNSQLVALQTSISDIILQLQSEPTGVISAPLQSAYIDDLAVTTTATVELTIRIPEEITSSYFYQIYRSQAVQATGTTILSDLTPSDELQLVYEAFPTADDLSAGIIVVEDITPDAFLGANLYTNPSTGEGIAQANDVPPVSKDINVFKNVVFYANTRTKFRKLINLISVQNMIDDYTGTGFPKLTITDGTTTNTYDFITGEVETTDITTTAGSTLASSGTADYFFIDSLKHSFYVWFEIGTATDPAISGREGIRIVADGSETDVEIAEKVRNALNIKAFDFLATNLSNTVTVSTVAPGYVDDASAETSGFTISVTNQGKGEKSSSEITQLVCGAGSLLNVVGAGNYFDINTPFDHIRYRAWYQVGASVAPSASGKTLLPITVLVGDTATQIATKTAAALIDTDRFAVAQNTTTLTISTVGHGSTTDTSAGTLPVGFTVTKIEDGALEVLLSEDASVAQAVADTALSLIRVMNSNPDELTYAFYLSGSDDVPGKMFFEARSLDDSTFYVLGNSDIVGGSFNPELTPEFEVSSVGAITVASPTQLTVTNHGFTNGSTVVISGSNSTPSIDGAWTITVTGANTFTIPVQVVAVPSPAVFSISSSEDVEAADNEAKANRIYYSKFQQPEAVPQLNYLTVGPENKQILRIFPLRDSLFVLKEDGLYRISGETAPFNLALFDSSCILVAPDSVAVNNNVVYGWTTQGVSSITESGVENVSRPIDVDVVKLQSYPNFKTSTWGMGYESDNSYTVYTVKKSSDTFATIAYRLGTLTNTWTTFDLSKTCGFVNSVDDKTYLGCSDINFIEQERKDFDRTDYADREYETVLQADKYVLNTISLPDVTDIRVGDVLAQNQFVTAYEYNMLLKKLDLDTGPNDDDYYSTLNISAGGSLRDHIVDLAAKLDADTSVTLTDYESEIASYSGTVSSNSIATATVITTGAAHNLKTGRFVTISGTADGTDINGTFEVTVLSPTTFSIPVSVLVASTSGTWVTADADFRDIKACYNFIITKLNSDTGVSFSNYSLNDTTTILESIVTGVNRATDVVTIRDRLDFVLGDMISYRSISSKITYGPVYGSDPLMWKHVREATIMFPNKAFTSAKMKFYSDLIPVVKEVPFTADGNGIFGMNSFGAGLFGGGSNATPFRTYVPRDYQRCRFLNVGWEHSIAREYYQIYGITLTGTFDQSERAYRS